MCVKYLTGCTPVVVLKKKLGGPEEANKQSVIALNSAATSCYKA